MKVIFKRHVDQFGEEATIPNMLQALQEAVGGYIETVALDNGLVLICNEEGAIRQLPYNFTLGRLHELAPDDYIMMRNPIFGNVVVCGTDGDEFTDVPIDIKEWQSLLCEWGN